MAKTSRRVTFTRTSTHTFTSDFPGRVGATDADVLSSNGGATATFGTMSIGELLAGAEANNGVISRGSWSVTGTSTDVEPFITRPNNTPLTLGQRLASVNSSAANVGARLFMVSVAGTTANSNPVTAEPSWNTAFNANTTDGTVTYIAIARFPSITNFAGSTAYALGSVVRSAPGQDDEFMVVATVSSSAAAPTWPTAIGATVVSGGVTFRKIA
jgi:hypothetical protein